MALSGDWTVRKDATVLNGSNGRIAYRFHARDRQFEIEFSDPGVEAFDFTFG
jgi:hypothetical protein